jgi:hypothetical protein
MTRNTLEAAVTILVCCAVASAPMAQEMDCGARVPGVEQLNPSAIDAQSRIVAGHYSGCYWLFPVDLILASVGADGFPQGQIRHSKLYGIKPQSMWYDPTPIVAEKNALGGVVIKIPNGDLLAQLHMCNGDLCGQAFIATRGQSRRRDVWVPFRLSRTP